MSHTHPHIFASFIFRICSFTAISIQYLRLWHLNICLTLLMRELLTKSITKPIYTSMWNIHIQFWVPLRSASGKPFVFFFCLFAVFSQLSYVFTIYKCCVERNWNKPIIICNQIFLGFGVDGWMIPCPVSWFARTNYCFIFYLVKLEYSIVFVCIFMSAQLLIKKWKIIFI